MKTGLFIIVMLVLSSGISLAQQTLQDVRREIERLDAAIEKVVLDNDYDAQLEYFTDDVIIDPPFDPPIRGKQALREAFERNKKEHVTYHSFKTNTEDLWVCGDKVYARGTGRMTISSLQTKEPKGIYGSFFVIWEKQKDGSYKIAFQVFTLDVNPFK